MKEFFQHRKLTGAITLTLSNKRKWSADKMTVCQHITQTVAAYARQGYRLTLRQLYYQLVAADHIPNDDVVYKKLSGILDDLRYSGNVDWDAIEDRGRVPYLPYWASGPADAMDDIIRQYRLDRCEDQDNLIEVWTEKDAISGILKRVTSEFHVRLVVNKGYSSSSAMHGAYRRFAAAINNGKRVKLLYFGDHDPSGLDMIRDIRERLLFFLAEGKELVWDREDADGVEQMSWSDWWDDEGTDLNDLVEEGYLKADAYNRMERALDLGEDITEDDESARDLAIKMKYLSENWFDVIPIGLTREQIDEFNPPPNPAKITDPRAKDYVAEHGPISWEVDALRPDVMDQIVRLNIIEHLDTDKWDAKRATEAEHVAKMRAFAATFEQ